MWAIFWGLLTVGVFRTELPYKRMAIALLPLFMIAGFSVVLTSTTLPSHNNGIILEDSITLREGDGKEFNEIAKIDSADGQRTQILNQRSGWTQIKTRDDRIGWVPSSSVAAIGRAIGKQASNL